MRIIRNEKVGTTISTFKGDAEYHHTEKEDANGRWDDHWLIGAGEFVIHNSDEHHVYFAKGDL